MKVGASVQAAAVQGPFESLGCDGRQDHRLVHTPLGLLQEETKCAVCGRIWTRAVLRVDKSGVLHRTSDPWYVVERRKGARIRGATAPGRRRVFEDEMPTSFSELEARRREQAEDLGLRPRRGRR